MNVGMRYSEAFDGNADSLGVSDASNNRYDFSDNEEGSRYLRWRSLENVVVVLFRD